MVSNMVVMLLLVYMYPNNMRGAQISDICYSFLWEDIWKKKGYCAETIHLIVHYVYHGKAGAGPSRVWVRCEVYPGMVSSQSQGLIQLLAKALSSFKFSPSF